MRRQHLVVIIVVLALYVPGAIKPARAEPTVDQILADIGLSDDERQQAMNGEFVRGLVSRAYLSVTCPWRSSSACCGLQTLRTGKLVAVR